MSGLKALKLRIGSVKSTRKITKAMQMVAAAKLKRAQDAANRARPYADSLEHILSNLSASSNDLSEPLPLFSGTGSEDKILCVVMTADRGLCGGFNAAIIKYARERIKDYEAQNKEVLLVTIGRRACDSFKKTHSGKILASRYLSETRHVDFAFAEAITQDILTAFDDNLFDVCEIVSSQFKSVISQVPHAHRVIPVSLSSGTDECDYEIEPDAETVLADILPKNLAVQVYAALLENAAGEQGARMSAMDNATRNAGDMINKLTLKFNRTRQANITKELIEIISGAEAL
ncbi:MAG: F0F1 ATP synthase subunit gamma [Pseudomonadota bacterium]